MRRPPLPLGFGLGLVAASLSISCGGCQRRVEEPLPEVQPLGRSAAEPGKPWGKRCVDESPPRVARCKTPSADRCPKDPEKVAPLRPGKVTFTDAHGGAITIGVEIAENDHDRQRGLMYRTSMPADQGMIFWFEEKDSHSFWMHNTCIPLDMLYLDADGLIVGIEESTPTLCDDTFAVACESKYVLEVNAGWTRAHGVKAGQRAKIEGI